MTDRKRIIVGVAGASPPTRRPPWSASSPRPATPCGSSPPSPRCASSAPPRSRRSPVNPVHTGVWDDVHEVPHVRIGQEADLVVVAPATADLLARAVSGRADDLLTATLLTARCPVLFAPAMHTEMWFHPATVDNVATLAPPRRDRPRTRVRSAHRRRHRRRPAARSRRDHHAGRSCCWPAATRCPTTWPASRCW